MVLSEQICGVYYTHHGAFAHAMPAPEYFPQSSCVWVAPCLLIADWIPPPEMGCCDNLSFYLSLATIHHIVLFYFLQSTPPPRSLE